MTREVVDACLFAGESDMLELRMRTLTDVVDHFVVVACTKTHQGEPADVDFISEEFNRTVLALDGSAWKSGATLMWVNPSRILQRQSGFFERPDSERGPAGSPWFQHIEKQHRNGVPDAVRSCGGDDDTVVMVSDVDEIPNPEVVVRLHAWPPYGDRPAERLVFAQRFHSGALDLLHPIQPWWGTCIGRLGGMDAQQHRNDRTTIGSPEQNVTVWDRGGWHFSWFGSDTERDRKLHTFSHAELVGRLDVREARRHNRHSNGEQLRAITVEESKRMDWPAPLLDGTFIPPAHWLSDQALGNVLEGEKDPEEER